MFTNFSYRNEGTTLDLGITLVDSDLNGNGASPVELVKADREAVFTYPDNTQNELRMFTLNGSHWINDSVLLSANTYYRSNDRSTFNGDGAELEVDSGFLVEEDGDGTDDDDRILNSNGDEITEASLGDIDNGVALNNTSETEQDSYGFGMQSTFLNDLFDRENQLIIGLSYDKADIKYKAQSEVAGFTPDRGTTGSGQVTANSVVDAQIDSDSLGLYFTDTISVTEQLALTLSGRYNLTKVDISGTSENGETQLNETGETHEFHRFNPSVGLTYAVNEELGVYGSYSEASRAPTPSELTCSNPEKPCALPNSFLSDPPLDQVVSKTWEAGIRGSFSSVNWTAGLFHSTNEDDIIFLPVEEDEDAGRLNSGYFDNVGETQRQGIELGANGALFDNKLMWFTNYSYVDATYETSFNTFNANNPSGENSTVQAGDSIPGIPEHNFKIGMDYALTQAFSLGFDASYHSEQYYRGDEANNNDQIDGYTVVNLHGRLNVTKNVELFAKVDNVFDTDYETFGLYGEADEAPGLDDLEDTRFVGAGAPRAGWVGIKVSM